jgi:hypothetical protein
MNDHPAQPDAASEPDPATDATPTDPTTTDAANTDPTTTYPAEQTAETPTKPKTRLRDRVLGIRGIAAVGLAGLVLGSLGGAAIGVAVDDDGDHERPARFGSQFPGEDGRRGPDDGFMPPGGPGQAPPSTAPDEETEPDGSTDNSGSTNS